MNRPIPSRAAIVIIVAVLTIVLFNGWKALKAQDPQKQVVDRAYCLKCHSDSKTVAEMEWKAGVNNPMFKGYKPVACPAYGTPAYKAPKQAAGYP